MPNISNALVYDIYEERLESKNKSNYKKRVVGLTTGEKLFYLFSVIVCIFFCILIVSNYLKITQLSFAISKADMTLKELTRQNLLLEAEVKKLSSVENIRKFAENKGLKCNFLTVISP